MHKLNSTTEKALKIPEFDAIRYDKLPKWAVGTTRMC